MPVYKGTTEIASGKLYKASANIENGYKGTNSFYINETQISFSDYPGVSPNPKIFQGAPGQSVSPTAAVSWSVTAASGQAYQNAPTITGLQSPYTYSVTGYGSPSNTTATFTVSGPSTYPNSSIDSDYDNLTINAPTSQVYSASLSISTSNFSGSGGSSFTTSVSGGISGAGINNSTTGGPGTSCSAGRWTFDSYNIPGVGSASISRTQSTGVTLPASASGNSYTGTVGGASQETWAAWNNLPSNNSHSACTAPFVRCYDIATVWNAGGGGTLNWSMSGQCSNYLNVLVRCQSSQTSIVQTFSNSGGYGGSCSVTFTGL